MKTFQNVVSAAVGLSALSLVTAAAISDSAVLTSSLASATATASGPVGISTTDTALPTTTATGGFVVAGIYTTCLTLTFAAPVATGTPTFTDTVVDPTASASSAPTVTSLTASALSPPIPIASGSASFSAFPSSGPIIPEPSEAVFTTCLAFLPSATTTSATDTFTTVSATGTDIGSVSASASGVVPTSVV